MARLLPICLAPGSNRPCLGPAWRAAVSHGARRGRIDPGGGRTNSNSRKGSRPSVTRQATTGEFRKGFTRNPERAGGASVVGSCERAPSQPGLAVRPALAGAHGESGGGGGGFTLKGGVVVGWLVGGLVLVGLGWVGRRGVVG